MGTCLSTTAAVTTTTSSSSLKDGVVGKIIIASAEADRSTTATDTQKSSNSTTSSSHLHEQHGVDDVITTDTSTNSNNKDEIKRETSHPIMRQIEILQSQTHKPFGRVLDAGTGLNSLQWVAHIASQPDRFGVTDWKAVTASETMQREVSKEATRLGLLRSTVRRTVWLYLAGTHRNDGGP